VGNCRRLFPSRIEREREFCPIKRRSEGEGGGEPQQKRGATLKHGKMGLFRRGKACLYGKKKLRRNKPKRGGGRNRGLFSVGEFFRYERVRRARHCERDRGGSESGSKTKEGRGGRLRKSTSPFSGGKKSLPAGRPRHRSVNCGVAIEIARWMSSVDAPI